MAYIKSIYRTGKVIEIEKRIYKEDAQKVKRKDKTKKTPEEIVENNLQNDIRKLGRRMQAGYLPGDYHITLTYKQELRPTGLESKDIIKEFLKQLRKVYKKLEVPLKWIIVTGTPFTAIHHHLIINEIPTECYKGETALKIVHRLWGYGKVKAVVLEENGYYRNLAAYLIRHWKETSKCKDIKQKYSCSRNLPIPEPEKQKVYAKSWRSNPKPPKGYYIDKESLYNGHELISGHPIQRYVLIPI